MTRSITRIYLLLGGSTFDSSHRNGSRNIREKSEYVGITPSRSHSKSKVRHCGDARLWLTSACRTTRQLQTATLQALTPPWQVHRRVNGEPATLADPHTLPGHDGRLVRRESTHLSRTPHPRPRATRQGIVLLFQRQSYHLLLPPPPPRHEAGIPQQHPRQFSSSSRHRPAAPRRCLTAEQAMQRSRRLRSGQKRAPRLQPRGGDVALWCVEGTDALEDAPIYRSIRAVWMARSRPESVKGTKSRMWLWHFSGQTDIFESNGRHINVNLPTATSPIWFFSELCGEKRL